MTFAFEDFSAFLAMGNHGLYVWSAWLVSFLGLLILVLVSILQRRKIQSKIKYMNVKPLKKKD